MVYLICYAVTCFACVLGTICGMGGGIIIKPVLDATGVMTVDTITFLSGCTVIAMSGWSVSRALYRQEDVLDMKRTPIFALAAAVGGLLGKEMYIELWRSFLLTGIWLAACRRVCFWPRLF